MTPFEKPSVGSEYTGGGLGSKLEKYLRGGKRRRSNKKKSKKTKRKLTKSRHSRRVKR